MEARNCWTSMDSLRIPIKHTAYSHLNLAMLDTALGADIGTIVENLDKARVQFSTMQRVPMGLLLCDIASVDVQLRQNNPTAAKDLCQQTFLASRNTMAECAMLCLDKLADLGHGMNDVQTTLCWAGVYISSAFKVKGKLAILKALRCFGEIFLAVDDDTTALSVFEVALEGFTIMGVHRSRANCMIRIAEILERRGKITKAMEFWNAAKPLFERSSQIKAAARVDSKLSAIMPSNEL
ncbi:hypothetical protein C8R44DRAFT_824108 [Mycena epipterygia]|nr:hypothetical protein C8R44DRAFT_824108 [Mycena epipterygia]